MADVAECVKRIVVDHLGVDPSTVTSEASFFELGADSLVVVELVLAFEHEFGISIPDEAVDEFHTVGDAVRFVEDKKSSRLHA
jgi:acyl carrier protein